MITLGMRHQATGNRKNLSVFLSLLLSLLPVAPCLSWASGPGTTTGELLKIPIGTRAVGMGEAFTALANDSSALYWNPAGMSFATQKEASFMHSSLIESVHLEQLSFVAPGDSYAFGTNASYLGYGDIAGYDNSGNTTGDVSAYSYLLNGGVSRFITDNFSLGLSGGLLHETLDQDSANTFVVNGGALYQLSQHPLDANYNLGMSVLNLGPGLKFVSERDPLPTKLNFGLAALGIKEKPINLTMDVTLPNDNSPYVSLGSEYWFHQIVALRLGYVGSNDVSNGLRIGVGLKYSNFLFDYAYGSYGDFGAMQRVSIAMRFGDKVKQLNNEERAILKEAKASEKQGAYGVAIGLYNDILERDPGNDHILHMMISTHDKFVNNQVHEEVAKKTVPIPSPEEAATADLIPLGSADALAQGTGHLTEPLDPGDPLNLNRLPDVNTLDVAIGSPKGTPAPVTAPVNNFSIAPEDGGVTVPAHTGVPNQADETPSLSPTDIYGN